MIKLKEIKSISIDMSTEEAPYNRIYAKPIEKQGDVLLCEFENANFDVEQKALKEENTRLRELLKECKLAIFDYPPYDLASDKIRLQIKINQVLGEK